MSGDGTMNTILNSRGIKDAIGVLLVVITGLLYATGMTETATDVVSDVGLDESSVGAALEVPQDHPTDVRYPRNPGVAPRITCLHIAGFSFT